MPGSASRLTTILGGVGVGTQPQAAGDDIPGDVGQPQVIDESIGAQPQVRVGDS